MFGLSPTFTYVVALLALGALSFGLFTLLPPLVRRGRPHRTLFQRAVLSFNVWLVAVSLITAGSLAYLYDSFADIPRVKLGEDVLAEEAEEGEPRNFLLVGVDSSEGLDPDDPVTLGRNEQSLLSDTIMILRVEPSTESAQLLSFPRDLWIPIAGTGGRQRINTALPTGGPDMLIRTIEEDFGIPIHHYVQVDFAGFKELVGTIGGVPMWFPTPVRDQRTGLFVNVPPEGACVTLEGDQALAFVRSRAFQTLTEDGWETDPTGDLGRISRQQQFIRKALDRAVAQGFRNPSRLDQTLGIAQDSVTLDAELTTRDLVDLGEQLSGFDSGDLQTFELPVQGGSVGGASVVFLVEDEAKPILDVFRGINAGVAFLPAIRVGVLNGSGEVGQGTEVLEEFGALSFSTTTSGDDESFARERTEIRYQPGQIGSAILVARYLPIDVDLVESDDLGESTVVVVTGRDFTEVLAEPRPAEEFEDLLPEDLPPGDEGGAVPTTVPATEQDTSSTVAGDVPDQQADC